MRISEEDLRNMIKSSVQDVITEKLSQVAADNEGNFLVPHHEKVTNSVFEKEIKPLDGHFKSFRSFLWTTAFNPSDKYLVELKAEMEEGDPESGGFLIPEPLGGLILSQTVEKSVIFDKVRKERMTSSTQKFPVVLDTDHSSNFLYESLKMFWVGEKSSKTESKPKLGQIELKARTITGLTYVTNQLLQDSSPSAEKLLRLLFANAYSWSMDEAIFRGTGAGQPLGILNSGALITVSKENGQAAGTVIWENVLKMWSQLIPAMMGKAFWYMHPSLIPEVMTMSQSIGTGGSNIYVEAGGAIRPVPQTLLGRPVIWTEHCNYLGQKGDVILAVPSAYLLGIRQDLSVATSTHIRFDKNETAFRIEARGDGQPQLDSTLTLRDGTHTVSPFITLEART